MEGFSKKNYGICTHCTHDKNDTLIQKIHHIPFSPGKVRLIFSHTVCKINVSWLKIQLRGN